MTKCYKNADFLSKFLDFPLHRFFKISYFVERHELLEFLFVLEHFLEFLNIFYSDSDPQHCL
jgi:hypothetical protein